MSNSHKKYKGRTHEYGLNIMHFICHSNHTINTLQIFGPVQCIMKFKNVEEVVKRANETKSGLAAGIFTGDVGAALELAKMLESGIIW